MLSEKQERALPRYQADLHRTKGAEDVTFDSTAFDAESDKSAISMALEWATSAVRMIDSVVQLRLSQDGRGVFSKTYGQL